MKKILVIAALALVSFANAQKGTILVAGNFGLDSWKQGDVKTSGFDFSPKVGYQFADHMTVGVEASINTTKDTKAPVGTFTEVDKSNNLKLGAFFRYSMPLSGAFSYYTDLGVGIKNTKTSNNVPGSVDAKSNGVYVGITPSVAIDLKKSFCLNFSIGGLSYDTMKADVTGAQAENTFNLNFGKQLNIGVSKNF